jgi:cobalt-zinc-cadmium resistance protein CzcA
MLVDAAVVVVENIEASPSGEQSKGIPRLHSIYRAVREVALPVTSGISVIMIVFLPLLTLQGLEGKLFAPVALTIIFALGASLLLSLTVIPVLASWMLRDGHHATPTIVQKMEALYRRILLSALAHQRVWMGGAVAALIMAAGIFPFLGKSFMPVLDEGDIICRSKNCRP